MEGMRLLSPIFVCVLSIVLAAVARPGEYRVAWHNINGSGVTGGAGSGYELSATTVRPDARRSAGGSR